MIAQKNLISLLVLLAGLSAGFFIAREAGNRVETAFDKKELSSSVVPELSLDPNGLELPGLFLPFFGFSSVSDLHNFALSNRMTDLFAELDSVETDEVCSYFGADSMLRVNLSKYLNSSIEVLRRGLFISESSITDPEFREIEAIPVPWILEEGVLRGSSAVLSKFYYSASDRYQGVLDEGYQAVKGAIGQKALLTEVRERVTENHDGYDQLISQVDYEIELFRLLDYYRQFFMNYYRWIDTGETLAKSNYQLALGRSKAAMNFHQEKYAEDPGVLNIDFKEAHAGMLLAGNASRSIRWARVIVVLVIFLLIMGIPGLLRDRAHQKFAGSLYFDAMFRPYLVSNLTAYHGTGRFAGLLLAIYFMALVVFFSFASLDFPLIVGGLGLLPVLFLSVLLRKGRNFWRILVSFLAPIIIIVSFVLILAAIRGPMFISYHFWVSNLFRLLMLPICFMLLFRLIQVYIVLARKWAK